MNRIRFCICFLALMCLLGKRLYAQSSFLIPVQTTTGQGISGATVTLTCTDTTNGCVGKGPFSAMSTNGNAAFTAIPAGNYTVAITGPNLTTFSYAYTVGSQPSGGVLSPSSLSNIKFANQFAGTDLGAQINAASTAAGAGGTVWVTASGTITTPLSLLSQTHLIFEPGTYGLPAGHTISTDGVTIDCSNPENTHFQISGAGYDAFTITNQFFRMARCGMEVTATATRAANCVFNLQSTQGELRDVRFLGNVTTPNNGTAVCGNQGTGTWTFFGNSHTQGSWVSDYNFKGTSSTVAGLVLDQIKSFLGLTCTTGCLIFDTLVDTAKIHKVQVGGTGPAVLIQNSGAGQAPRFVHFVDTSIECGGTGANTALTITAGRGISFMGGGMATCQNAANISGGTQIAIEDVPLITNIGQHCIILGAGATNVTLRGNFLEDCGVTTTATYDYFQVAAGTQDFHIDFNHFRQLNANLAKNGIELLAGATAQFTVLENDFSNAAISGGSYIVNGASGASQHICFNIPVSATACTISSGMTATGSLQSTLAVANQGTACTNGELALSAGWQSTGSATVTAVAGLGQTCSWTITTGTTTAANPTVTDTLTNVLPAATTRCWMFLEYGPASTHTAAAGEGFAQTTLSSTAPVFTFNGTPTAAGKTYLVVRTCGP